MGYQAAKHGRALRAAACAFALLIFGPSNANSQQSSISAWDAADFRIWGFVPYWSGESGTTVVGQLNAMSAAGTYNHVSDVIYFGGVRPTATGGLSWHSTAAQSLQTLENLSAQHGFRLHMSMFDVSGGSVDAVWTSIVSNPTYRDNFIDNLVDDILLPYNMSGFNFDWERPANSETEYAVAVSNWGNYTQLARELGNVIRPLDMEVSVCDYGGTDTRWDDSPLFDARVYDQLFIMGYHHPANHPNPNPWNNNNSFANGKNNLDDQNDPDEPDVNTAFVDEQLTIGVGTWGNGGPATVTLRNFVAANPNLAYNATSVSGTFVDVGGDTQTGTWNIESRQQVREKTQLALDRDMPGMFSWTLHYDARNELGLHRVMHHYAVFKRGVPDLNLDGDVNATDANALADKMGTVPGWTGTNTAARFDDFYLSGNWEQGDRDGNGFVNQQDADWLAGRFATLGVNLPDRLAYSGTFENFQNCRGLTGRWRAKRESGGNLRETGNFTQRGAGYLSWSGTGVGADKRSNYAVTIRNQNAAEAFDGLNTLPRSMTVDLAAPIDLGQNDETYFTFLVRHDTAGVSSSQLDSSNRTIALEFLNSSGVNQFDFAFHGLQQQIAIRSQADTAGQDVSTAGLSANTTYFFVGKIAGNGAGANTMRASLFSNGSSVGNFASPSFPWAITAQSSAAFNPLITQLQFTSLFEANYTVSNVWIGSAADFFALPSAAMGDFNADGMVDAADYLVWRKTMGQTGSLLAADGNGNGAIDDGDYDVWRTHFGEAVGGGGAANVNSSRRPSVPEPAGIVLVVLGSIMGLMTRRQP